MSIRYIGADTDLAAEFKQLVGGVIWLVKNGTNYVQEALEQECADTQETGKQLVESFLGVEILLYSHLTDGNAISKLLVTSSLSVWKFTCRKYMKGEQNHVVKAQLAKQTSIALIKMFSQCFFADDELINLCTTSKI